MSGQTYFSNKLCLVGHNFQINYVRPDIFFLLLDYWTDFGVRPLSRKKIRFLIVWDYFQLDLSNLENWKSWFLKFSIFLGFSTEKIVENRNFQRIKKFSEYLSHHCQILFLLKKITRKSKNISLPWLQTDLVVCVVKKWANFSSNFDIFGL